MTNVGLHIISRPSVQLGLLGASLCLLSDNKGFEITAPPHHTIFDAGSIHLRPLPTTLDTIFNHSRLCLGNFTRTAKRAEGRVADGRL